MHINMIGFVDAKKQMAFISMDWIEKTFQKSQL
jgi:hypothetical protein